MSGGACCVLGVCCPPERQAIALANALEIPPEAAQAISGKKPGEGYLLVPRSLPAMVASDNQERGTAFAQAAAARLERLNKLVKTEMRAILSDLGHEVEGES